MAQDKDAKHLKNCSAECFLSTWKKYDADGNGYIEDKELSSFLADLMKDEKETDIKSFRTTFMEKYDKNRDKRIDVKELAEVLQPEENFLFFIRNEGGPTSVDFKKIWDKYDADSSGFIEAGELKNFLKDTYACGGKPLTEEKLDEYTKIVLELYDIDGNNKLDFKEMLKLLPINVNYLAELKFDTLTESDFERIFAHYDKNKDGSIDGSELDTLFEDMLRKGGKPCDTNSISTLKSSVMQHCDANQDGKLQKSELKLVFQFQH